MQWMANDDAIITKYPSYNFAPNANNYIAGKLVGYEKMITSRIDVNDTVEKGFNELVNNKDEHIKIMETPRKGLLAN